MKRKKISIVTGIYNEEETVEEVSKIIKKTFKNIKNYEYEHIFLDNCSTDKSLSILKKMAKLDKKIKILSYSRNFGPIKSGFISLQYVTGDATIFFEGNLKDPASLIPTFIKYWESGFQFVYGVRKKTADNFVMEFMRKLFYQIMKVLSSGDLPPYFGGFGLVDKVIINEIKKVDDYKPYLRGLFATVGFKQKSIEYVRGARPRGYSKSNYGYMIDFTINAIISYSILPIRFCTFLGLGLSFISIMIAVIYLILNLIFFRNSISPIALVTLLILFFSGIQLFFLGVIGEYIGAIHSQVRQKPFVIIREKVNF